MTTSALATTDDIAATSSIVGLIFCSHWPLTSTDQPVHASQTPVEVDRRLDHCIMGLLLLLQVHLQVEPACEIQGNVFVEASAYASACTVSCDSRLWALPLLLSAQSERCHHARKPAIYVCALPLVLAANHPSPAPALLGHSKHASAFVGPQCSPAACEHRRHCQSVLLLSAVEVSCCTFYRRIALSLPDILGLQQALLLFQVVNFCLWHQCCHSHGGSFV